MQALGDLEMEKPLQVEETLKQQQSVEEHRRSREVKIDDHHDQYHGNDDDYHGDDDHHHSDDRHSGDDHHFCHHSPLHKIWQGRNKTPRPLSMVMTLMITIMKPPSTIIMMTMTTMMMMILKVRHSRSKTPSPIMRSKAGHFRADSQPPAR